MKNSPRISAKGSVALVSPSAGGPSGSRATLSSTGSTRSPGWSIATGRAAAMRQARAPPSSMIFSKWISIVLV
jgi:hypothetical protein